MPYYNYLKQCKPADRKRIVEGIQRLRREFDRTQFPFKKTDRSLILGTWNIRNFDDDRFNYGPRSLEALYYITEIISRFDVLAVQEVCEDVSPLDAIVRYLGRQYEYILTDVTHSSLGGNRERLGFIYDRNKVKFRGIAGEIVLPEKLLISDAEKSGRQFSRTPFGVEFQSGWFKFQFSTVHIYFGSDRGNTPQFERRVKEIEAIANYLAKEARSKDSNQILVGDFNIRSRESEEFNALEKSGFTAVQNRTGSNRDQTKYYDQISFLPRKDEVRLIKTEDEDRVFQFFNAVYRPEDFGAYKSIMKTSIAAKRKIAEEQLDVATSATARKKLQKEIGTLDGAVATEDSLREYYEEWRTFQMSDHLPLWVELEIDFSEEYLENLKSPQP
ncbi:MAG: endonuclease/exonuclease/phosphatase family protein [Pyrinomonadaceae bacterium]